MKSLMIGLIVVLSSVATSANAAWCRAESSTSWGYGTSYNINVACKIALQECAVRTNHHDVCIVVNSGY